MSEPKHTEGPFYWSDSYKDSRGDRTWSLIGDSGFGILSCDGMANSPNGDDRDHIAACLSACEGVNPEAVPELLDIAYRVGSFSDDQCNEIEVLGQLRKLAKAALAKAKPVE